MKKGAFRGKSEPEGGKRRGSVATQSILHGAELHRAHDVLAFNPRPSGGKVGASNESIGTSWWEMRCKGWFGMGKLGGCCGGQGEKGGGGWEKRGGLKKRGRAGRERSKMFKGFMFIRTQLRFTLTEGQKVSDLRAKS